MGEFELLCTRDASRSLIKVGFGFDDPVHGILGWGGRLPKRLLVEPDVGILLIMNLSRRHSPRIVIISRCMYFPG